MKCALTILTFAVGLPLLCGSAWSLGFGLGYLTDSVGEALGIPLVLRPILGLMFGLSSVGAGIGAAICVRERRHA